MRIGVIRERLPGERRVAVSPDSVKKLKALGFALTIESGAGAGARLTDAAFAEAGATIVPTAAEALGEAGMILKVRRPLRAGEGEFDELAALPKDAILIGLLDPLGRRADAQAYADQGIVAFALELVPRITRAQGMDALSSQSNVAGYKAVLDAAARLDRMMPMMMTAAGTIAPAKVLVLGAGVAGLQAIATARRLGAVVSAFDVRPAVKQEVESLGASFVEVPAEAGAEAQTVGGYAREMGEDYKRRQAQAIHDAIVKVDIVVSTALIPGRPAPRLITAAMIQAMTPGSIVIDMAAEAGGNCELCEAGKVVERHGVTIVGEGNYPSRVATDASTLLARNLLNFVTPLVDKKAGALAIDWDDEIVKGSLVARDGKVVHPLLLAS
ncbi:MAG: Re/Si-specific NAD(P)(+) transhydrogenase subunit alpha [Alphaproteobacteria bacterium]|nr:Re/Si-specific NAD(P)(+) transhydrogenase subunit alpha [Alphaproteobacteria bacterium]